MEKNRIVAILILIVAGAVTAYFIQDSLQQHPTTLKGTMFVSDAGRSHGGFEYNAEWNASLYVQGSKGKLDLVLRVGLGDALKKNQFEITDFKKSSQKVTMNIEGKEVSLIIVEKDEIWGHLYDGFYIASWGSDAPPEEIRGTISPTIFPGLYEGYYVELRLG